ncbi:MAG: hypothetical protein WBQ35_22245 [Candidatus Sulfotelmatobacter sp.]
MAGINLTDVAKKLGCGTIADPAVVQALHSEVFAVAANTVFDSDATPGVPGQIAYDTSYLYICVAPNTWRRAVLQEMGI